MRITLRDKHSLKLFAVCPNTDLNEIVWLAERDIIPPSPPLYGLP
jgi:hypothetical protein